MDVYPEALTADLKDLPAELVLTPDESAQFRRYANDLFMLLEERRGRPGWFSQRLFDLMMHSDSENLAKLSSVYPIHAAVLKSWHSEGIEWLAEFCGRTLKP